MVSRPIIISIEGNIGAGKTTIIDKLQEHMKNNKDVLFLREPVDIWESIKDPASGDNILQKFYADSSKYAFPFQVMAYATRLSLIREAIRKNPDSKAIICERSLDADKNIFAQMLFDYGAMEDIHFQIYKHFYHEYSNEFKLDGIVYIDAVAEKCHERVAKRSRDGESDIGLEYLQKCKHYHDKWLLKETTCHIDATPDVCYQANDLGSKWLCQIESYIQDMMMKRNPKTLLSSEQTQLSSSVAGAEWNLISDYSVWA